MHVVVGDVGRHLELHHRYAAVHRVPERTDQRQAGAEVRERRRPTTQQVAEPEHAVHAIAAEVFVSVKTVQNHVSALLENTGASSRAQLVARARDASSRDIEPR